MKEAGGFFWMKGVGFDLQLRCTVVVISSWYWQFVEPRIPSSLLALEQKTL